MRPGQVALFVHRGRVADVFGTGTHRLETRNLPILSTLAGWKHFLSLAPASGLTFTELAQTGEYWWDRRIPRDLLSAARRAA